MLGWGADVSGVDVRTTQNTFVVGCDFGDTELGGSLLRKIALPVANGDDVPSQIPYSRECGQPSPNYRHRSRLL